VGRDAVDDRWTEVRNGTSRLQTEVRVTATLEAAATMIAGLSRLIGFVVRPPGR